MDISIRRLTTLTVPTLDGVNFGTASPAPLATTAVTVKGAYGNTRTSGVCTATYTAPTTADTNTLTATISSVAIVNGPITITMPMP